MVCWIPAHSVKPMKLIRPVVEQSEQEHEPDWDHACRDCRTGQHHHERVPIHEAEALYLLHHDERKDVEMEGDPENKDQRPGEKQARGNRVQDA